MRGSGMKKSEGDRLKCAVYESTRAPLTRYPFPNGKGCDTSMPLCSPPSHRVEGGKRSEPDKAVVV